MMQKFIYSLFLLLLVGCGSTAVKDAAMTDVKNQLELTQQQQAKLEKKLDALVEVQQVANDDIKFELEKTRDLIDQRVTRSPQNTSSLSPTSSARQQLSKAQWLANEGKVIVGGIENITFIGPDLTYAARIDTGATSSSLDAREVTRFERDGDRWVKFKLYMDEDHFADIERPVVRLVRVYTAGTEEGEQRPVVEMAYQFGDIEDTAEFTLTDRSHLEFAALVGRNIITDRMIVDVSDSYIFGE